MCTGTRVFPSLRIRNGGPAHFVPLEIKGLQDSKLRYDFSIGDVHYAEVVRPGKILPDVLGRQRATRKALDQKTNPVVEGVQGLLLRIRMYQQVIVKRIVYALVEAYFQHAGYDSPGLGIDTNLLSNVENHDC